MPKCLVRGCLSRWGRKNNEYILHIFPKDMNLGKKWLVQLGYSEEEKRELLPKIVETQKIGRYRICSRHFSRDCYEERGSGMILKKGSIPTLELSLNTLNTTTNTEHDYARPSTSSQLDDIKHCSSDTIKNPNISMLHSSITEDSISCLFSSQDNSSQSVEYFMPEMIELDSETEIVIAESMATSDIALGLQGAEQKSRKTHSRSMTTYSNFFPGQHHNLTHFDKSFGCKNKKNFHRPLYKSVGIQCNLDERSTTTRITSQPQFVLPQEQGYNIKWLPFVEAVVVPQQINIATFASNEPSHSVDPRMQVARERDLLTEASGLQGTSDSDDSFEPPEKKRFNVSYNPTAEEEEEFLRERDFDEDIFFDPNNLDNSSLLLPESSDEANPVTEKKFIVFESCLDELLMSARCKGKIGCMGSILKIKKYRIGTAVSVTGYCSQGHKFHLWRSQPLIGRMPVGNLLLSAGVLCSGSRFVKVESMLNIMGIYGICKTTHEENQTKYLFPTINYHWRQNRLQILNEVVNDPVALSGDGQFDSPGHSSKYYTYSFLETKTKKILDFQIEKVKPGSSSVSLKTQAFETCLDRILSSDVNVKIVCTGRHAKSIRKKMKTKHPNIVHQFDVWHVAKSIGNKIAAASKRANTTTLSQWVTPAKNHLLWSAQACNHDPVLLREQWSSILYHVCNVHKWENGDRYKECHHPALRAEEQREKQWLVFGSPAHTKFMEIVLNPRLLKDMKRLSNFCHIGELDMFHNIALKYCPKGNHSFIEGMVARIQLAALDYNNNIGRLQPASKETPSSSGESERLRHQYYLKKSRHYWVAERIFEHTNQNFIFDIIKDLIQFASGNKNIALESRLLHEPTNIAAFTGLNTTECLATSDRGFNIEYCEY